MPERALAAARAAEAEITAGRWRGPFHGMPYALKDIIDVEGIATTAHSRVLADNGAGLAAGFFPAALGTDTGGSIRNPASMCGITGMKPTYGRVSRRGVVPLAFSLDHVGPMTRTVRDNALMLQVIAGHDPADPASADEPVPDYGAMLGRDVKGLRIGVIRHFYTTDVAGDPEQVDALDAAVRLFAEAGAETTEITLPPLQDFGACGQIILAAEAYV